MTLINWLSKYGLHDRNSLTTMQAVHSSTHTYMTYSITLFLQNQENAHEKHNRSNSEPQCGSRFVLVRPHLRSTPLKWQLAVPAQLILSSRIYVTISAASTIWYTRRHWLRQYNLIQKFIGYDPLDQNFVIAGQVNRRARKALMEIAYLLP